ncbi:MULTISPECIES: hypothetical protein [Bacteroides]|uniref:hypothetical protein n=1 Tax=Bacteroides TaxID=816 RepID=UPI0004B32688|nr:hypothetical protein [Bacteroides neonati]
MSKKTTHRSSSLPINQKHSPGNKQTGPSAQTLNFLRAFARNYHTDMQLPQGIQGIILG